VSVEVSKQADNRIVPVLILAGLLAVGLWLRWRFIQTVQLYPDEFVTLLAIRMIGEKGLPIMPSGLFYEHGLLFSYLGSLAWLIEPSYQAARYVSLLFGSLTALLTFWLGRRWFSPAVGLMATAGLIIAPIAVEWSGRARMYSLLQFLTLLTLWLAYEGLARNRVELRWLALVIYLGATLSHFVAVTLAPPLVLAGVGIGWLRVRAGEKAKNGVEALAEPENRRAEEKVSPVKWRGWLELVALAVILGVAFLVKRAGQPKGIEVLAADAGSAAVGLLQVFEIYSDFSFNLVEGWQAIAPFYLNLPALIFTPLAFVAMVVSVVTLGRGLARNRAVAPLFFLTVILMLTTLEMTLFVSPERRDDKYLFMLLPVLLLLGAQGMAMVSGQWSVISNRWLVVSGRWPVFSKQQPLMTDNWLLITGYWPATLAVCLVILLVTWPRLEALLANTGDDYAAAFAYVQAHWQEGDAILTGTPAAAAFYLGGNDFYCVQRRGGYDYRVLNVAGRAVDRWLASPAIRSETELHQALANRQVWLVLERWGLQREYYDLPFQQQLLAQTDYVSETQGVFILRAKANPRPLAPNPVQLVYVAGSESHPVFGEMAQLIGYTVEPETGQAGQPVRLTLYWQALASMPHDYTVFVHLRRPAGGKVSQADHRPLGALYPTSLWPVDTLIRESSDLFLPADLSPGEYELWVGMYLLETGERLPVRDDTSGENAVWVGKLKIGL
jgi:hypothetical protein